MNARQPAPATAQGRDNDGYYLPHPNGGCAMATPGEVAALRAQFHTQAEQRDFISDLVENMPHAQIAAEFDGFKAEVAAALEELRKELADTIESPAPDEGSRLYDAATRAAVCGLDAVITKLGLTMESSSSYLRKKV